MERYIDLLKVLKQRFTNNPHRHENLTWEQVEKYFRANMPALEVVGKMENLDGEPDVIEFNQHLYYVDFCREHSKARTSIAYDASARIKRKHVPPQNSALEICQKIGAELMSVELYKFIQSLEDLDLKTSTWLLTGESIRSLGGALFGDKRYGQTFIYHNGADSYYGVRGFRAVIKLY